MFLSEADKPDPASARGIDALEVVARVLDILSGHAAPWRELNEALAVIGGELGADRVDVLQNGFDPDTGFLIASTRTAWRAGEIATAGREDETPSRCLAYHRLGERWLDELSSGRAIQVRAGEFTPEERAILEWQDVRFLLVAPLMIGGAWWGVITCAHCSREREWDGAAVRALTIAGSLVASRLESEKLRVKSETAFRAIFEGSPEGMLLIDTEDDRAGWSILDCNAQAAAMHGHLRSELLGSPRHLLVVDPPDAARAREEAAQVREKRVVRGEAIHVRKDGSTFWCEFQHTMIDIDGRERLLAIERDVTEKRRRDDERLRTEKLEALGLLAGGIAHDFNNVLTTITGNLSLLRMDLPGNTPVGGFLDAIESAASRARELAAQLLTFARGGMPVLRITSLADVAGSAAHVASRGSRSKVSVEVADDTPKVEADESQMSQVLQNLIINADQAMPEGGVIHVSLDRFEESDLFGPKKDACLRIRVRDTGTGIPPEVRKRIFDPYFTTKAEGSGLGLATAHSIVRQHRGSITVESEVGKGAEFTILLPAAARAPESEPKPGVGVVEGRSRILVMDDEPGIRELALLGLNRFGYEVVVAKDGEDAIAAFEKARDTGMPFDAVVLDMVIPGGVGGEKTLQRLRAIEPGVRGLAISGYSQAGVIGNPEAFGFKGGLAKPFSMEQLAGAIGRVIAP